MTIYLAIDNFMLELGVAFNKLSRTASQIWVLRYQIGIQISQTYLIFVRVCLRANLRDLIFS